MKVIKKILLGLVAIIVVLLIVALFVPKNYVVEREVSINQPKDTVFNYIKYLKNQNDFSVWANLDPEMKTTYTGKDGTVGAISSWESKQENVGIGEQEIIKIIPGDSLIFALRFKEPMEDNATAYMTTTANNSNKTIVKWGIKGTFPYPMNLMQLFMNMDEMIGKDLEGGLQNLKEKME